MDKKKYIIASMILILIMTFYLVFMRYREAFIIDERGYLFTSNKIIEKLNIDDLPESDSSLDYELTKKNEKIYKKGNKFYIGKEEKKEVNINFPIISEDGSRITNLTDSGILITDEFKIYQAFDNSILTDGTLYNGVSLEKVDKENYLLLKADNNVFINSVKLYLSINSEDFTIKENSVVNFLENEIRYYYLDNGVFKYNRIGGISHDDKIKFFESEISYKDFLINLEIINDIDSGEDDLLPDIEDEIVPPTKPTKPTPDIDTGENEYVYVKPDASGKINNINIYSLKVDVVLNDPARRVETNPTFEIKINNRVYVKRVFYSSGTFEIAGLLPDTEFEIIGYFTYRDDKEKLMRNTFLNEKFKTKDISGLENIKLTYDNKEMFPNKIEFTNLAFNNNENDEVLKGIKSGEVVIGDSIYTMSNTIVNNLKKLNIAEYSSPTALKSNTYYDVEYKFYDIAGNQLKVENARTKAKTSKQRPSVEINVTETDLTYFTTNILFTNSDDVFIDNIRYILTDNQNQIITSGKLTSNTLKVENLDVNTIYELSIYGDYDIEDGKGIQKNIKLKSAKISTKPISTLGFVRMLFNEPNVTQHEAKYNVIINKPSVDPKLIELLQSINITIKNKETEEIAKSISITGEDIVNLKNDIPYNLVIDSLTSKTEYTISIEAIVTQGTKEFIIQGVSNVKEFKTLKKEAIVEITNRYTSENLIDFDVRTYDVDGAINTDRVMLEVRDATGTLIGFKNLDINGDYERLAFDKLEINENYTFTYYVEEYNIGYTNATYEQDKVLLEEVITTTQGIHGEVYLESLLKQITSKNLFDISNNTRWKKDGNSTITDRTTDLNNRIIRMSAKNGYATYSYYLPEGKGKVLTISFYARQASNSNMENVYISNGGGSNKQIPLQEISTEWKKYSYVINLNSNNYIGFYINEIANNNTVTTLEIKDLMFTEAKSTSISDSYHLSNNIFKNTKMFSGNESMPNKDGGSNKVGNEGNGIARITNNSTNEVYDFSYTGGSQIFTVPATGTYKFETWGAQGGSYSSYLGGKGAYTSGNINLTENTKIYIYVGGQGPCSGSVTNIGGYNGGGYSGNNGGARSCGGGGSTDIRLKGGNWNNLESLKSRIMVAAGGGGASTGTSTPGGAAGGIVGSEGTSSNATYQSATYLADGGNQFYAGESYQATRSGGFGYGIQSNTSGWGGGGGSGFYGGANGHGRSGAGGSSYISGHTGCVAFGKVLSQDETYIPYNEKETYKATLYASLNDSKDELVDKEFYIQVIRDGILEDIQRYDMKGETSLENVLLEYNLQKNANYEILLSVKIRDRYYPINSAYFTTEEEIRTIKTIDDFFGIHTNGKYLVLNDLDFRNVNRSVGFWFSGKIDFQGNKIFLDVEGSANQLMSNIQTDAVLSNMDVHFDINNTTARSNYYGLFYDFRGKVTNLKITVEESTNMQNVNFCLMAYVNRGTIENFVINNKAGLTGQRWTSLGMMHNYGTLKNGYVYGEALNVHYPSTYPTESKRVGALAGYAGENSRIENVFSLIPINGVNPNQTENPTIDDRIGSLVGEHNRGILANAYSYTSGNNRSFTRDANIGNYGNVSAQNIYYISDNIYNPAFSLKVPKSTLKDLDFHEILNSEDKFNIKDFVTYGYYPQLKWPSSMPNQEYIKLPTIDDADLVDIISVKETSNINNETTATLIVNNPNNEKIMNIGIKDIATVEILNQEDKGGKSEVKIKLSNPLKYVSKYYMKSITSRNVFGKDYTRSYADNERVLMIDMYRDVYDVNDWQKIKTYPTENFILRQDIDFLNVPASIFQINNLQGVVNGDGHTIKNIEVTINQGIFNELRGQVKNLFVENYTRTTSNAHDRFGVVGQAFLGSIIDNVHVKNIKMYSANRMGGLIGYADGAIVRNSSVTNATVYNLTNVIDIKVGGLIGEMWNSTVENSYAQDINFDLTNARTVFASSGLIGYAGSGSILNVYASGYVESNSENTGGIAGRNGCYIQNSISNVEIVSKADFVGGIAGYATNSGISNSVSIGSIYSHLSAENLRRIAGNVSITNNNYAWDKQHINGKITGDVSGEQLLTKDDLSNRVTYEELIALSSNFNYDNLENGKIPKLYATDGKTILPNQKDIFLEEFEFEVNNIEFNKAVTNVIAKIEFENPNAYQITDIIVEDMKVDIRKNENINGTTVVEMLLTPEKYFDSYRLSEIKYRIGNEDKTYGTNVKIDAQFYKDLEKFEDWQKISQTDAENYRLIADIDFDGKTNINTNVVFNRLEGIGTEKKVLKNMNVSFTGNDKALIKAIYSNMNNVEFNNISITNTSSSTAYRNGLILYAFGRMSNVNFKNITLNLSKSNYVGIISFDRTVDLRDIDLYNIYARGRDYTSAFIAKSLVKGITNINFDTIDVYGTGSYVGGLIAHSDYVYTPSVFHITGRNGTVKGSSSYVGGAFGYSAARYVDLDNMNVTGAGSYTGGIAGHYSMYDINYNTIINSTITSTSSYVGGLSGAGYNLYYSNADNIKVYGTGAASNYVGGLVGGGGYTNWYSGIKNSEIEATGNYVGGIRGFLSHSTVHSCYVFDSSVKGKNYVGGIVGGHQSVTNTVARCISNATVTATETGAGGILGYAANSLTDSASNKIYVYHNITANSRITASNLAGGLIGRADKAFYPDHVYGNIVSSNVFNTNTNSKNAIIGSSDYYSVSSNNLLVFDNSTLNGNAVNDQNGLQTSNFVSLEQLKLQATYTNIGINTSYFNFDKLATNHFPYLKNMVSKYMVYFKLPEIPNLLDLSEEYEYARMSLNSEYFHLLPEYDIYVSDVDKINIEFSEIDKYSTITINGQKTKIDKKVKTFQYNFKEDLKIKISDTVNSEEKIYKASDLRNTVYTNSNYYYLLKENYLISNNGEIKDRVVNLFNNKVLLENGSIIDLEDKKKLYEISIDIKLLEKESPLYSFDYNGLDIKTYYNYSTIGNTTLTNQIFVKNGNIEMLQGGSNTFKESIIIDNYNNKNFLTILSKDGYIYNLKDKIATPEKFDNLKIKKMSNNISNKTNLIAIEYENNGFMVFDYRSGEVYYKEYKNTDNIVQYFQAAIKSSEIQRDENKLASSYSNSKQLISNIEKDNIIVSNQDTSNKSYISVYSANKNSYDIYDITSLTTNKTEELDSINESVTDIINKNANLSNYYMNNKKKTTKSNSSILIYLIILTGIILSSIMLGKNIKQKRAKN